MDVFKAPPPLPEANDDPTSAVLFLSPPSAKDKERLRSRSQEGTAKRASPRGTSKSPSAHQQQPTAGRSSPAGKMYTPEDVKDIVNERLSDYEAKRDEEEQRMLDDVMRDLDRGRKERDILKEDNDNLQRQVDILTSQVERAKADKQQGHHLITEAEAAQAASEREHQVIVERLKGQCMDLTRTMEELHVELQEYKQHCGKLKEELRSVQHEAASMRELDREELRCLEEATHEREAALEAECNLLRSKLSDSRQEASRMEQLLEQANGAFIDHAKAEKEAETKLLQKEEAILDLQQALANQRRQYASLEQRLSSKGEARREEREDQQKTIHKLEEACKSLTEELRKKSHRVATAESNRDELKAELKTSSDGVARMVAVLKEVQEITHEVVAACKGSRAESTGATSRLRGARNVVPSYVGRLSGSRSRSVSPSGDSAERRSTKQADHLKEGVAIGSDVVLSLHYVVDTVGMAAGRSKELATLKDELQQLRSLCEAKENERAELSRAKCAEVAAALDEKRHSETMRGELEDKTASLIREHHQLLDELQHVRNALAQRSEEQSRVLAELDLGKLRLEESRREQAQLKATVAALELDVSRYREEAEAATARTADAKKEIEFMQSKVEQAEREAKAQGSSHERSSKHLKKLTAELREAEETIESKDKELRSAQIRHKTAESQLALARKRIAKLSAEEQAAELAAAPKQQRIATESNARQLDVLQKEASQLRQQLGSLEEEKTAAEDRHRRELSEILARVEASASADQAALDGLACTFLNSASAIQASLQELCRTADTPYQTLINPTVYAPAHYHASVFTAVTPSSLTADRRSESRERISTMMTEVQQGVISVVGRLTENIREKKCSIQFLELEATSHREQLSQLQARVDAFYAQQQLSMDAHYQSLAHQVEQTQQQPRIHHPTPNISQSHSVNSPAVRNLCPIGSSYLSPQPQQPRMGGKASHISDNGTMPFSSKRQPSTLHGRASVDSRHSSAAGCSVSPVMDGSMSPPPIPRLRASGGSSRPRRSHSAGSVVLRGPSLQLPGHTNDRDVMVARPLMT